MNRFYIVFLICVSNWLMLSAQPKTPAYYTPGKTPVGFESEINQFLKADSAHFPPPGAVLFAGSSTIRLWKGLPEDFKGHMIIQRGFGGSNMKALDFYIHNIVLAYKPAIIVVYEGDNDLAAGVSPSAFIAQCDSFIRMVQQKLPETKIYFLSIKPSIAREKLIPLQESTNLALKKNLTRYHNTGFIDVCSQMFDSHGKLRTDIFGPDGLHMNRKGYLLWIAYINHYFGWKQ
jgi:hypothetical protein